MDIELTELRQIIPDLVIHGPHHIGGAGDFIVHLQQRVQKISLFGIVNGELPDAGKQLAQLLVSVQTCLGLREPAGQNLILPCQGVQWVAGDGRQVRRPFIFAAIVLLRRQLLRPLYRGHDRFLRIGDLFLSRSAVEQCGVNVAEFLNLLQRRALAHQLLLGLHDLGSLYVPKLLRKIRPDTLQGFTRAQTA